MIMFWPKTYRLRLLGIKAAVAHVQTVLNDGGRSPLGYPDKHSLVKALVYMVSSKMDSGSKYHWDGAQPPSTYQNPMLSEFWHENSADAEALSARILASLLKVDDFDLFYVYLVSTIENEVHPRMRGTWLPFHACIERYGWDTLAKPLRYLLENWAVSSCTAAAHVPFGSS